MFATRLERRERAGVFASDSSLSVVGRTSFDALYANARHVCRYTGGWDRGRTLLHDTLHPAVNGPSFWHRVERKEQPPEWERQRGRRSG